MTTKILFVCLGNICRSPMAEAVMRHLVKQEGLEGLIEVDSAGTGDWHIGHPPHEGTRKVLDRSAISYEGMRARQIIDKDKSSFEYVVCMDMNNLRDVRRLFGEEEDGSGAVGGLDSAAPTKLFAFMELLPERDLSDVPDPYYSGNFDYVYELVEDGCKRLLKRVRS